MNDVTLRAFFDELGLVKEAVTPGWIESKLLSAQRALNPVHGISGASRRELLSRLSKMRQRALKRSASAYARGSDRIGYLNNRLSHMI